MLDKKDMNYNFEMLFPRLIDSFEHLDNEKAKYILNSIRHNCLCTGTGGSNSVSYFASKVLDKSNGIISLSRNPRDILYTNVSDKFGYLLGFTYGNNNYGIDEARTYARERKLSTRLVPTNPTLEENIGYKGLILNEYSFISIASTVIPMSIMLNYYIGKK